MHEVVLTAFCGDPNFSLYETQVPVVYRHFFKYDPNRRGVFFGHFSPFADGRNGKFGIGALTTHNPTRRPYSRIYWSEWSDVTDVYRKGNKVETFWHEKSREGYIDYRRLCLLDLQLIDFTSAPRIPVRGVKITPEKEDEINETVRRFILEIGQKKGDVKIEEMT